MTAREWLTTSECAALLGVTGAYIRGEIEDGRLEANRSNAQIRPGRKRARRVIRVRVEHFRAYCQRHWPNVVERLPAA